MDDLGLLALRLAVAAIVIYVSSRLSSFCSKALVCILDSYKLKHIPGNRFAPYPLAHTPHPFGKQKNCSFISSVPVSFQHSMLTAGASARWPSAQVVSMMVSGIWVMQHIS